MKKYSSVHKVDWLTKVTSTSNRKQKTVTLNHASHLCIIYLYICPLWWKSSLPVDTVEQKWEKWNLVPVSYISMLLNSSGKFSSKRQVVSHVEGGLPQDYILKLHSIWVAGSILLLLSAMQTISNWQVFHYMSFFSTFQICHLWHNLCKALVSRHTTF